jgi:TolB protein
MRARGATDQTRAPGQPWWSRPGYVMVAALAAVGAVAVVWLSGVPQRGDRIAFVAEENGSWDLWWMRGDGTGAAQLTSTPLDERAPSLSPDRSQIAYSTSDGALWVLSTGDRKVTRVPLEPGRYSNPSWSPDGRQIVFTAYTLSNNTEDSSLWLYDVGERKPRQLLLQDGAQDYATFSPDGRTLIYSSSGAVTVFGFGYAVVQQLWTLSLVTGRAEELLLARGKDTQPAWSPDGRALVFVSDRDGIAQVWRADASGSGMKRLTNGPGASTDPAWSPSGNDVVFVASDGRRSTLATIAAEGGESRPVAISGGRVGDVRDPDWR